MSVRPSDFRPGRMLTLLDYVRGNAFLEGLNLRIWLITLILFEALLGLALARELLLAASTNPYSGHTVFVPCFAVLMLWAKRSELRLLPRRTSKLGLVGIFGGLALLLLTRPSDLFLRVLSYVFILAGTIRWRLGPEWSRATWFPLVFLVFSLPLPFTIVNHTSLPLRLFATEFSSGVLSLAGISHYHEGTLLALPTVTLQIADACNGLRFLAAFLVLTVAFAEVSQTTLPRKLLLVLAGTVMAILANATRVAVIALGSYYVGAHAAHGLTHHAIGKSVWICSLLPMALIARAILKWTPRRKKQRGPLALRSDSMLPSSVLQEVRGATRNE